VNTCPVCRPYAKKGYQELSDGRTVPCYACNRAEFVKQAVAERGEVGSPFKELAKGPHLDTAAIHEDGTVTHHPAKLMKLKPEVGSVGQGERVKPGPPYSAIDKLLTDRFGWPWEQSIQTLYAGICDLFDKPHEAQPEAGAVTQTCSKCGNKLPVGGWGEIYLCTKCRAIASVAPSVEELEPREPARNWIENNREPQKSFRKNHQIAESILRR
jgi:hypothetical protein